MQTAVYVLYQRPEFSKASCFLTQVAPFLGADVRLYLLINDEDCGRIRDVATSLSPHIHVITAGRNLGVAGGRNYLVRQAISDGAEFLVACDTDILFEPDYFRRLAAAYAELRTTDPEVGLVQPILFNGPDVRSCFDALQSADDWSSLKDRLQGDISLLQLFWPRIRDSLGEKAALKSIMHTGMSNIWRAHFGDPVGDGSGAPEQDSTFVETYRTRASSLRNDHAVLAKVMAEGRPVRIGTTAGGISAFHKTVFEKSGGYDEIFNPFGYEDSEFGFRTLTTGFHHYLIPGCSAIHDLFISGQNRSLMYAARIGLLRGVEAAGQWLSPQQRSYAMRQSVLYGVKSLVATFTRHAKTQPEDLKLLPTLFPSALASYAFEFFRGLLHSALRGGAADLTALAALLNNGSSEIRGFSLPLDENVTLQIRRVIKRGSLPIQPDQRFSLHGFNCHIAEQKGDELLQSRHFDISVQVQRLGASQDYQLTIDILSDDVLHKVDASFTVNFPGAARDGIVKVTHFATRSKAHDYGSFSTEDLYPQPNIYQSARWLRIVETELKEIAHIGSLFGLEPAINALIGYLNLGNPDASKIPAKASPAKVAPKKRVLIFTDSRGQHKPAGTTHKIFAERLADDPRLQVDTRLCPMKWTTTLDFLASFSKEDLAAYDHVILYTGIVDWSPRRLSNALNDLYDNPAPANLDADKLNTTNYARKVVNRKKDAFDRIFGADEMARHFAAPFPGKFEGEPSINMYRLVAAREKLIPILAAIPNLVFINANRIVPGWRGDYPRERPANMALIHDYSNAFAEAFPSDRLINLMNWSEEEVKLYTCDNLHLTKAGSDYIHDALLDILFGQSGASAATHHRQGETAQQTAASLMTAPPAHRNAADLLRSTAAELLLDPSKALADVNGPLADAISASLAHTVQDDPLRQHFLKVLAHAKARTVSA